MTRFHKGMPLKFFNIFAIINFQVFFVDALIYTTKSDSKMVIEIFHQKVTKIFFL